MTRDIRNHSSDDMTGLRELAEVIEPTAVVIRPDGSVDVYGYVGVVDQRQARRRNLETTTRRDGYPAARVLDGGQRESDRLMSAHAEAGGSVRLDIINPETGEIKAWSVSYDSWHRLVADESWERVGREADADPPEEAHGLARKLAEQMAETDTSVIAEPSDAEPSDEEIRAVFGYVAEPADANPCDVPEAS